MNTSYTVEISKGTFALNREEYEDLGVSICLPEILESFSEEQIREKFVLAQNPTGLKVNTEHKIMFTINSTPMEIPGISPSDDSVNVLILEQQKVISRLTPGYQEYGVKSKLIDGHMVACLNYKSQSLEDDMYNIFYVFLHRGKMINGMFSCPLADQVEWNLVFLMCLDTLQFAPDKVG